MRSGSVLQQCTPYYRNVVRETACLLTAISSFEGRGKSGQWSTTCLLHPLDRQGVYERWLLQILLDTKTVKNRLTKFSTFIAQLSHPSSVVIRVWQNDYLKYDITLILISQLCLGNRVTRAAFFLWQQCCHADAFSNLNSFYLITLFNHWYNQKNCDRHKMSNFLFRHSNASKQYQQWSKLYIIVVL